MKKISLENEKCFIGRKVIRNYWPVFYGRSISHLKSFPREWKKPFKLT